MPTHWTFPVYDEAVCRALARIHEAHTVEESKLTYAERVELAEALHLLAVAAHIQSQIAAHGSPVIRPDGAPARARDD